MTPEVMALLAISPWKALIAAAVICCSVLLFVRVKQLRVFRCFRELERELGEIASKLERGTLARDKGDVVIAGRYRQVPFTIRFSHSETAPGLYLRCSAPANFEVTFVASTPEIVDASDVCRTGDVAFDRRFVARTDNRPRTKQLFAQPNCLEYFQQLCCSNKTMLRLAGDAIELSEALIPADSARHVISHIESMVEVRGRLAAMTTSGRATIDDGARNSSWTLRLAGMAALAVLVASVAIFRASSTSATAEASKGAAQGQPRNSVVIPNSNGWTVAEVSDLNPEFVGWMKQSGITPETVITLDPGAGANSSNVVHVLRSMTGQKTRRVVWMMDKSVVSDLMGPVDGVARIPKESLSKISWAEGSAPSFTPDGDGLLVVRDESKPGTATVYYLSERALHTAVPADFKDISLF